MPDETPIPPEDLPLDAGVFWHPAEVPPRPAAGELPSALERLGASPFAKSKFPFLGFLATVYDQVAASVTRKTGGAP